MGQQGFWDFEARHQKLESKKDLLVCLDDMIPWDEFRPILDQVHVKPRKSNAGRHPIKVIVMFKLLILQQLYNIGDEELEYQVNDRLSFMRFLHLGLEDSVPDAKTVGHFGNSYKLQDWWSHCLSSLEPTLMPLDIRLNVDKL